MLISERHKKTYKVIRGLCVAKSVLIQDFQGRESIVELKRALLSLVRKSLTTSSNALQMVFKFGQETRKTVLTITHNNAFCQDLDWKFLEIDFGVEGGIVGPPSPKASAGKAGLTR